MQTLRFIILRFSRAFATKNYLTSVSSVLTKMLTKNHEDVPSKAQIKIIFLGFVVATPWRSAIQITGMAEIFLENSFSLFFSSLFYFPSENDSISE